MPDAIAWSDDLLADVEHAVFAQLGVVVGGVSVAVVAAVCNAHQRAAREGIGALVDRCPGPQGVTLGS